MNVHQTIGNLQDHLLLVLWRERCFQGFDVLKEGNVVTLQHNAWIQAIVHALTIGRNQMGMTEIDVGTDGPVNVDLGF